MIRQSHGRRFFFGETCTDLKLSEERVNGSLKFGLASSPEVRIQFTEVAYSRDGHGETSLHGPDSRLGVELFVASGRHAKERLEYVMTGQGAVARMDLALTPLQDQGGDCLGIVPPDFILIIGQDLIDGGVERSQNRGLSTHNPDSGLGSACFKTLRIVFRECSNSRASRLMDIPSRWALRMAP